MPFSDRQVNTTDSSFLHNELKQSHAELLQIFEVSSIGMAIVSLEGKWLKVNKHLCQMLGYSSEELVTMNFNHVTHPEDTSIGTIKIKELLDGKTETLELEKRYVRKDGSILYVLINSSLIRDLDGKPKYLISQTKDITALKQSVEALKLSEEKFRLVFEKAPIGITHFDKDGNITLVNQVLANILGSSVEKIKGIDIKNIPDSKQRMAFEEALNGKVGHFEGEYTSITGGKTSFLKAIYAPLFNSNNSVIGGIGITEDITAEKIQENKLIQSLQEKELLLKEVYHRVKNNLQIIISLINIQMSESKNEEFIEGLMETKSRLFAISKVHEVLYQSGNFVSVSLFNYINHLTGNLDYPNVKYELTSQEDVQLNVEQTHSLGIIISELITNSVKHNMGHNIVVSLSFSIKENGLVHINYADNGVGLTKPKPAFSTSLGMNLVEVLVEDQLDGRINYINDKGFHILIEFPLAKK